MQDEEKPVFKRIYVCLAAFKRGRKSRCESIIGPDGTHTKGLILIAMGIDANNLYYPIAYAVVEKECYMTWLWFLEFIISGLGLGKS